ncbi:MAG TPA: hypothetical protein VFA27_01520 [Vicinamibacterales bacterium]|nr:hypothetical protein [Vicinamibacterales bacterium]
MDERPADLEHAITETRGRLDRDLHRLGARVDVLKDRAAAQAQWWAGVSAVAVGVVGAILFWPRHA